MKSKIISFLIIITLILVFIIFYKVLNKSNFYEPKRKIKNIPIDINVSWLNPEKVRKITIITNKKMILFDEMNIAKPIQIYDNYANYPKISKFTDDYFSQKAFVYRGKSRYIKLKDKMSLDQEILDFINNKKNISDIDFATDIIKISNKIIN